MIEGDRGMQFHQLVDKIAHLEFVNDQLTAEIQYIDELLRSIGFTDGLNSVKNAAQELLDQEQNQSSTRDEDSEQEETDDSDAMPL